MAEWWHSLTSLNRFFYGLAAFFSVFFVWQLLAILLGLDFGEADAADALDAGDVPDMDVGDAVDILESTAAFQLVSLRSVLMFCTLFSWGTALYLNEGLSASRSVAYATAWGVGGMLLVAVLLYFLRRLSVSGTGNLSTCVGQTATVYVTIPENGVGQVRATVSGVVSYVKARAVGGKAITAGTMATVVRRIDQNVVEVEPVS